MRAPTSDAQPVRSWCKKQTKCPPLALLQPCPGGEISCPGFQAPKLQGEKAKAGSHLPRECRHRLLGWESAHLPLPPSPPRRAVKVSLNILENVKYTARCQLPKTIKLTLWTSRDFLEPVRGICLTSRRFLRSNFEIKPLSI